MSSVSHRRIGCSNRGSRTYLVELLVKVLQLRALAHTLLRIQRKHAMARGASSMCVQHSFDGLTLRMKKGVCTGVKPRRTRKESA